MAAADDETEQAENEAISGLTLESFVESALFDRTFEEGMSLVEECARYLDGRGREEARTLSRKAALIYAGESMRVTTRLMQAASWLLVQRAVHEGDMSVEDAASDRYRLGAREICFGQREEGIEELPDRLLELLERSGSLYRRVARFDDIFFGKDAAAPVRAVHGHLARLQAAFGDKK